MACMPAYLLVSRKHQNIPCRNSNDVTVGLLSKQQFHHMVTCTADPQRSRSTHPPPVTQHLIEQLSRTACTTDTIAHAV